jgi:transposase
MEAREARGLEIAANSRIFYDGSVWIVPSQRSPGKYYSVQLTTKSATCTCPDYESIGVGLSCKHIYAVGYTILRDSGGGTFPDPPKQVKPRPKRPWHEYNLAQTNEKSKFKEFLYELCRGVEDLPRKPGAGRNRLPLADMIFCMAFNAYSQLGSRRGTSDLKDAQKDGYISSVPHFNSVLNYLELEEMTAYLKQLITEVSLPLNGIEHAFAVDSSGFSTYNFIRWLHAKYTDPHEVDKKDWLKVHLACGVRTHTVTAVEVSDGTAGDCPYFVPLIELTSKNFVIYEVSADKAYSSSNNLQLVLAKGGQPYIPFKKNSNATGKGQPAVWKRLFHYFQCQQEEFLAHYHKRSNVETVFSMVKAKFGQRLRSRSRVAQVNELLCKILCHNICCLIHAMYELGIEVNFCAEDPLAQKLSEPHKIQVV